MISLNRLTLIASRSIIVLLISAPMAGQAQYLYETPSGDPLILRPSEDLHQSALVGVNVADSKFSAKAFFGLKRVPAGDEELTRSFLYAEVSGKSNEGILALFKGSNFNPGVEFKAGYSRVKLFDKLEPTDPDKFTDFVNVSVQYRLNKLTMFNADTAFSKQLEDVTSEGYGLSLNYVAQIKTKDNWDNILSVVLGYELGNNYSSLPKVELTDEQYVLGPDSTVRTITTKSASARRGKDFKELELFHLRFAYAILPPVDEDKILRPGLMAYVGITPSVGQLPKQNVGISIIAMRAADKTGIRTPVLSLTMDIADPFNINRSDGGLIDRMTFSIGTTLNLFTTKT